MVEQGKNRLIVNINHLRQYNEEYAKGLLEAPLDYLPPFDKALKDVANHDDAYYIGLTGNFGDHQLSPRELSSAHLGKMICMEGIVTRCN
jgi:DNA replication licensing factor MCM3